MAIEDIYLNNDSLIELVGLKDTVLNTFINDATVTATIYDDTGTEVTGISWPLTVPYVTSSNGEYRAVLDKAIELIKGNLYTLIQTAVSGSLDGEWITYLRAQERI